MAAELLTELQWSEQAKRMPVSSEEAVALLGELLAGRSIRPPYGGHPRVFIWGLLEARLQQADLMILGGLNEGVWPGLPAPDPWLAPKIRSDLGLPGLEYRIGLAAHDFASALGSREVLITRAKRDGRSPLVSNTRVRALSTALNTPGLSVPLNRVLAPPSVTVRRPSGVARTMARPVRRAVKPSSPP